MSLLIVNLSCPAFAQTTFDPLSIGVGARALGMGKAYVAVAENCDTIFTNPAGLGEIDSFEFISMSGTLLEDVNYTVLGGVYPLGEKSAMGFGYAAAAVGGIEVRNAAGTLQQTSNFGNSVFLASYGRKLSEKLSLGLNFKYFSQNGDKISSANGTGMNLDIGLLQKGLGWLSIGVVGQNILSSGKIRYKDGTEDALPLNIKVGTRMFLLGEEFESAILSPIELSAVIDADLSLQSPEPTTIHIGFEFAPSHFLILRTGIDQDPVPGGIVSNTTYGLSLKYAGIGFHYAYHPYGNTSANATSYFSISFDERGWPFEGLPETFLGMKEQPTLLQI
ncbi:MAG: PorV/PorQ family protein [Candidatus Margulisiibacteriota bacterium]